MENHPTIQWEPGPEIRADGGYVPDRGCTCPLPEADAPGCGCSAPEWCLYDRPLATVYVPVQPFGRLYDPCTALSRGTMFEDLDKPFEAAAGGCGHGSPAGGGRNKGGMNGRCGCGHAVLVSGRG